MNVWGNPILIASSMTTRGCTEYLLSGNRLNIRYILDVIFEKAIAIICCNLPSNHRTSSKTKSLRCICFNHDGGCSCKKLTMKKTHQSSLLQLADLHSPSHSHYWSLCHWQNRPLPRIVVSWIAPSACHLWKPSYSHEMSRLFHEYRPKEAIVSYE